MPKKTNRRKETQAAKRKAAADEMARKNKKWPGTRKVLTVAHHHTGSVGATMAVMAAVMQFFDKGRRHRSGKGDKAFGRLGN